MATKGSWMRVSQIKAHLDADTINPIVESVLVKRAETITKRPELRKSIGEELLRQVTPFVPEFTGRLKESGRVTNDGRLYWSAVRPAYNVEGSYAFNYANITYDPKGLQWPDGKYGNPKDDNTYPRWVERVHPGTPEWTAFINNITPEIRRAFAEDEQK